MTIKQVLKDLWNKRYLNSKERYARHELFIKWMIRITAIGLCVVFVSLCYWSI